MSYVHILDSVQYILSLISPIRQSGQIFQAGENPKWKNPRDNSSAIKVNGGDTERTIDIGSMAMYEERPRNE